MNEYYIIPVAQLSLLDNSDIVESQSTARRSLNGQLIVCKTKAGITGAPFMNPNTAMTHAEVRVEMAKPAWTTEID